MLGLRKTITNQGKKMEEDTNKKNGVSLKNDMKIVSFLRQEVFRFFLFGLFVLAFTGCGDVKTLPPLDKKMATDECAIFVIPSEARVKQINGEKLGFSVWWAWFWNSGVIGYQASKMHVPAGENNVTFNYYQSLDGFTARNIKYIATMDAGKMYILSIEIGEESNAGFIAKSFNNAASFIRDNIVDLVPFTVFLPIKEMSGNCHIKEIDQAALDLYLLEKNKKSWGLMILTLFIFWVWFYLFSYLRIVSYSLFMKSFKNNHKFAAFIVCIVLVVAGIIIISNNSDGNFLHYLLATILLGVGLASRAKDIETESNKK